MCAAVAPGEHVAGHRQHIASLFECTACRNERPALLARLDDDDRAREAADDAIALGEMVLLRWRSRHELAQDGALVLDLARQGSVLARIDDIGARPKNRYGAPRRRQRPAMGRRIHAARQAGDDNHSTRCQIAGQPLCDSQSVRRCRPRPDDRDRWRFERRDLAAQPQHGRGIDDGGERRRIRRIAPRNRRDVALRRSGDGHRGFRPQQGRLVGLPRTPFGEQSIEDVAGRVARAKPFADATPPRNGQQRQRDQINRVEGPREVCHDRASWRRARGHSKQRWRPNPRALAAQGPNLRHLL